ncbi:hypothetical protein LP420_28905 [Massilia sp. B-10]|nr:hypothetical protein LP420_28905 [Massilia sp. B-10]
MTAATRMPSDRAQWKEQDTSGPDADRNADTLASRIGGLIDEVNWEYAVIERVNRADLTVSLIPFNLGRVFTDPA